jgi:hypothetical protein
MNNETRDVYTYNCHACVMAHINCCSKEKKPEAIRGLYTNRPENNNNNKKAESKEV